MKLNGYRATHRNRWLLLLNRILSPQEFLLFEYYLDSMDFDQKHLKYGQFDAYIEETAKYFDKTAETISDWHNGLLNKGFIETVNERREIYKIKSPERYSNWFGGKAAHFAKEEKITPTLDFILQNICFSPKKVEIIPEKNSDLALEDNSRALGSSKDEYGSFPIGSKKVVLIKQSVRSDSDYQKLFEKDSSFSIENMKLADEVTEEKIEIDNEEQEKEIVRIFFDGDWNEYQKHLITS